MKLNILSTFKTFLTTRICKTLARCWLVSTQEGTTFGFTTHTRDIVFDGITYYSVSGLQISDLRSSEDLIPDTMNLSAFLSSSLELYITTGFFDNAYIEVFLVNYMNLDMDRILLKVGYTGEISRMDGVFSTELRGLSQILDTKIGRVYSASCDAILGDDRCRVPILPVENTIISNAIGDPTNNIHRADGGSFVEDGYIVGRTLFISGSGTSNNVSGEILTVTALDIHIDTILVDESAVFLTLFQSAPFFGQGTIVSVIQNKKRFVLDNTYDLGFLNQGTIKFVTGGNTGLKRDIRIQVGNEVAVYLSFPFDVEAGDEYEVTAGCNKVITTCRDKFANQVNFQGFPYTPTQEGIFSLPIVNRPSNASE